MERLQKVIAEAGVTSRRKAEQLILDGKVVVNGEVVTTLGTKVDSSDEILVEGKPIVREEKEYYLLNKPRGVVTTTSDDKGRETVVDLIKTDARIYPVGRLDYDTTGVILLTNDGEFANIIMHPNNDIDKVYVAKLNGIIKGEQINRLKKGVLIDKDLCKASRVKLKKTNYDTNSSIVEITIHSGKYHQVKRMFETVGILVDKLKRERLGIFTLDNLGSGDYRKLTPKEVATIYSLKK